MKIIYQYQHTFLKKVLQKTYKKFKTHIIPKTIEQINDIRKTYSKIINKNEFLEDIVSIDETSININDLKRYGYIKKGKVFWQYFFLKSIGIIEKE